LAEAARVRARGPLPAAGRVLGERAHFPARVALVCHALLAPVAATHPTAMHGPRLLVLVLQDLGRHANNPNDVANELTPRNRS